MHAVAEAEGTVQVIVKEKGWENQYVNYDSSSSSSDYPAGALGGTKCPHYVLITDQATDQFDNAVTNHGVCLMKVPWTTSMQKHEGFYLTASFLVRNSEKVSTTGSPLSSSSVGNSAALCSVQPSTTTHDVGTDLQQHHHEENHQQFLFQEHVLNQKSVDFRE
eukprot:4185641-Ditylum_brightwellii.AAC.1